MLFLSAAAGKAFTTVFAGFAFTITSLPNIIFCPALVAGFTFVLIITKPGSVNFPTFTVSLVPISATQSSSFVASLFFISIAVASALAMAPLLMGVPPFIAFMAFMDFGAMGDWRMKRGAARSSGGSLNAVATAQNCSSKLVTEGGTNRY